MKRRDRDGVGGKNDGEKGRSRGWKKKLWQRELKFAEFPVWVDNAIGDNR